MRGAVEDLAEKHMDLSWIMNSSTAIDLPGKEMVDFRSTLKELGGIGGRFASDLQMNL